MAEKIIALIMSFFALLFSFLSIFDFNSGDTDSIPPEERVSYIQGSELIYDMMETSTTYLVTQHKALGGSHYAYTEGLFEESTGEAASNVGSESNFRPGSDLFFLSLKLRATR